MIKNIILTCLTVVLCISCSEQIQEITLYKNIGEVDRTYDVTEETFWDFKKDGDVDSLKIDNKVSFSNLYNKVLKKTTKNKPFLNPEYAVIIKTSKSVDTIYMNDKLDKGYSIDESIMFDDNDKIFLSYFEEKGFITLHTKSLLDKN